MAVACGLQTTLQGGLLLRSSSQLPIRASLRRRAMPDRVLVVDDDSQMLKAVTNALGARGYQVQSAGNGETALALAAEEEFDLVLLDLGLPGIEGHAVIERLRTWSEVPVIVISVRDGQEEKVAALDAGADDFVTKP